MTGQFDAVGGHVYLRSSYVSADTAKRLRECSHQNIYRRRVDTGVLANAPSSPAKRTNRVCFVHEEVALRHPMIRSKSPYKQRFPYVVLLHHVNNARKVADLALHRIDAFDND